MKKLIITILFTIPFISHSYGSVDCLRFMSKKAKIVWTKNCQIILEDFGSQEVESIDACFGKYKIKNKEFIVFNSNLTKRNGFVKKDSIISSALLGAHAKENEQSIAVHKKSASPELFKKYLHIIRYNKNEDILAISKYEGRVNLKKKYDLVLSCE